MKTPLLVVSLALLTLTPALRAQTAAPTAPPAPAKPAVAMPPQKAWVAAQKYGPDG